MIFGQRIEATIIVAKNLFGYNSFVTSDFTKPFKRGEVFEIFYPPDHPSAGEKYTHASNQVSSTIFGKIVAENERSNDFFESDYLNVNQDYIYPLQTNLVVRYYPSPNSAGLFPVSDSNETITTQTDYGIDAFIIKGSVICGVESGAKRYYAVPFKGFTKENECVCEGATATNNLDGSDCRGWLKGSFYETGYVPSKHDMFNYSGEPRVKVDVNEPFNSDFMVPSPFGNLNYTWYPVHNRQRRPIPYSMQDPSTSIRNNAAILISKRHVIVSSDLPWVAGGLKFYSPSQGIITRTNVGGAIDFDIMWETIGFIDKNTTAATYEKYLELQSYFGADFIIGTLNEDLPDDVVPVSLIDIEKSDPIFFAMAIGQESRGHCGTFCPPLSKTTYNPTIPYTLLFKQSNSCPYITDQVTHELPSTEVSERTCSVVRGDIGAPVTTYYHNSPILVGWVTGGGVTYYSDSSKDSAFANVSAIGIGSSKEVIMPWGAKWSPLAFLNAYLATFGQGHSVTSTALVRDATDTNETYPYPNTSFSLITPKSTVRKASVVNDDPRVGIKISETGIYKYSNRPYTLPEIKEDGKTITVNFIA